MNTATALDEAILDTELRHINFFNGRLLTGGDLETEQKAQHAHARQLGNAIGPGVAFGLEVSPVAGSPPFAPVVQISAGLAVNRTGQTLRLQCNQEIALVPPADAAHANECVFKDCPPRNGNGAAPATRVFPSSAGFYLLTIGPASRAEGKAPVSGLGNSVASCNSKFFDEGVIFELVRLNLTAATGAKLRSVVARDCFGLSDVAANEKARKAVRRLAPDGHGFESHVAAGSLGTERVALALIEWTISGMGFVDLWAVRRRIRNPGFEQPWQNWIYDERWAEAEALFQQFQNHLLAVLAESPPRPRGAHERFVFLPPAVLLPVGSGEFGWRDFLGEHAPRNPTPIPLDEGLARAILRHSLGQDPVVVVPTPKPAGAPVPVPFHVYQVAGWQNIVLLARSSFGEVVADDVAFDNSVCQLSNANNVQTAIEELCKDRHCCATVIAPGAGWEGILPSLVKQDAHICFQPGEYRLDRPLQLSGSGNLIITGAGRGTKIVASRSEAAFIFSGFKSVLISDLAVTSGAASPGNDGTHLNGGLTFQDCGNVETDRVAFACAAAANRTAACLTVRNTFNAALTAASAARVRRCEFDVGHQQVGVLLVNVARVAVEDNILRAGASLPWNVLITDRRARARLRTRIVSGTTATKAPANATGRLASGTKEIAFRSPIPSTEWSAALEAGGHKEISDPRKLAATMNKLADTFLIQNGVLPGFSHGLLSGIFGNLAIRTTPSGNQAVVVSGRTAPEIRILNNTMTDFMQGVHIGVSHHDPKRAEAPDRAGMVLVAGNKIQVRLVADSARERHAIFIGNCDSLVIENNYVTLARAVAAAQLPIEGIRLFGTLGPRLIVRANHLAAAAGSTAFNLGIRVQILNRPGKNERRQWYIGDNLFAASPTRFQIESGLGTFFRGLETNVA
jgi:hypothetical protein